MFRIKQVKDLQNINTHIGSDTIFWGSILCNGNLRIDGTVKGDIKTEGDVYIGDSALITGNITSNNITIGGIVEGNIISTGILKLLSTAKLNGDVHVGGLIADNGGTFVGKCNLIKSPQKVLEATFIIRRNEELPIGRLAPENQT